uniref:Uncharacterized protein n=1 Tax=Anguilla anguilla TaxID=7936 RepID=A0A0E9T1Q9_ANGAN
MDTRWNSAHARIFHSPCHNWVSHVTGLSVRTVISIQPACLCVTSKAPWA